MSLRPVPLAELRTRPADAVRVLHTSDWHLGVAVRHEPRDIDHDAVITEILGVAAAARPDLIVHTGDLFNSGRPAMADFGRAIRALRDLAEVAPVVVLAGNHDSAIAMETLGTAVSDVVPALAAAGAYSPTEPCPSSVRVIHRPMNAAHGAVATYPTASGARLRFVGLPFVHANRVAGDWEQVLVAHSAYTDGIAKIAGLLTDSAFADFDRTRDVALFASHLHVTGARTSTEKEIHVSSEYATDPAHLDSGYGYLAFGHIHIAQAVAGGRGRYAGSILEVDFGEEGETKQVVVVDMVAGRPSVITDVALTAGRRIHRISAPYSRLATHAEAVANGLVEVTVLAEPSAASETLAGSADLASEQGPSGDGPEVDGSTIGTPSLFALDGEPEPTPPTSAAAAGPSLEDFDSLAAAVHAALPEATVVGVLDGRRPDIATFDDLDVPDVTETPSELFRAWLADSGRALFTAQPEADPARVAALFEEVHASVTTESDVELRRLDEVLALAEGEQR